MAGRYGAVRQTAAAAAATHSQWQSETKKNQNKKMRRTSRRGFRSIKKAQAHEMPLKNRGMHIFCWFSETAKRNSLRGRPARDANSQNKLATMTESGEKK